MVPKMVLAAPNPQNMDLARQAPFILLKVRCSDLPCVWLNPNDVKYVCLAFAFPSPRGK
jgi:hypothetical protein